MNNKDYYSCCNNCFHRGYNKKYEEYFCSMSQTEIDNIDKDDYSCEKWLHVNPSYYYKQLLAEQANNKKLVEALEFIKTKYEKHIAYLQVVEDITKALNEVNNAK